MSRLPNSVRNCITHIPSRITATFMAFDDLPDSAYVALPVVCALYDCSPATVWRRVASGQLVAPHRLGTRTTRWRVGELRAALIVSAI
jgi:prophage regulatory protein